MTRAASPSNEALDRVFHALGDATRRGMVSLLAKRGESTAGEVGAPFDIAQPTASKHIRVLEEAGIVTRRVQGRTHRIRIEPAAIDSAVEWVETQRAFWSASLDGLDSYLKEVEQEGGES